MSMQAPTQLRTELINKVHGHPLVKTVMQVAELLPTFQMAVANKKDWEAKSGTYFSITEAKDSVLLHQGFVLGTPTESWWKERMAIEPDLADRRDDFLVSIAFNEHLKVADDVVILVGRVADKGMADIRPLSASVNSGFRPSRIAAINLEARLIVGSCAHDLPLIDWIE